MKNGLHMHAAKKHDDALAILSEINKSESETNPAIKKEQAQCYEKCGDAYSENQMHAKANKYYKKHRHCMNPAMTQKGSHELAIRGM
ncbi:MAG: hypothetical protein LBQ30_00810 [Treponema sp.]|nr:hypothetical protein [Treponema sp.]